jgi:curved DNA-binding protein
MHKKNYYSILEIERTATGDQIRKAYYRLALEYHPDRNPDSEASEDKFKEISEAYAVLGDPKKRRDYDQYGHGDFQRRYRHQTMYDRMSASDLFEQTFFTKSFFGGCGCGGRRRARGTPNVYDLVLEPHEAHRGSRQELIVRSGFHSRRVIINIPPRVEDGTVFRVTTDGRGGIYGDFFLRIKIER